MYLLLMETRPGVHDMNWKAGLTCDDDPGGVGGPWRGVEGVSCAARHSGVGVSGGEAGDEELPARQHPVAAVWGRQDEERKVSVRRRRKGWP